MRTSLAELERLEHWLLQQGEPDSRLVTEAKVLINADLLAKAQCQQRSYELIRHYGRSQLRKEILAVEQELFQSSRHRSFQKRILSIFNYRP
ncbi:MAG: hypothetical protein ACFB10_00985 [Salibacteraceae bacterium]|mgnify:CR=1 FL=1